MLSIITPVLNGAAFIEKNIRSVQNLDLPHEHIIVDGGSSDGTLEILERYPHLKVYAQAERNGMYGAIAQGINMSKGEYISYLNADDIYTKEIQTLYQEITEKQADIVYGNAHFHYMPQDTMKVFHAAVSGKYFLRQGMFPFCQSSSIFSRQAYMKAGGFRADAFRVAGDLDLYQRIAFLEDAKVIFRPVTASVFLKYGASLGDKSMHLYETEWLKLTNFNAKKLHIRAVYWLARQYSKLFK